MTRISEIARLNLGSSFAQGVTGRSPLEDQAALVFRAANQIAKLEGFDRYVLKGHSGHKGQLSMLGLCRQLFGDLHEDEIKVLNSQINQVLRRTTAAVCLHNPQEKGKLATWFIADKMPSNLTVVAIGVRTRKDKPEDSGQLDRMTRAESRLTPEEAGETLPPGEVTVKQKAQKKERERSDSINYLKESHERARAKREQLKARILEEIATNPVPLTQSDILTILNNEGTDLHRSTVRDYVRDLLDAGRIIGRQETETEALIRGGGSKPKARRPLLYAIAPGPVPERTQLPAGITPERSAMEWAELDVTRRRELDKALTKAIFEGSLRSLGDLVKAGGRPESETREALARLISRGLIRRGDGGNSGRYYPIKVTPAMPKPTPQKKSDEPVNVVANPTVQQIVSLVQQLASTAADTRRIDELEAENAQLRERNEKQARAIEGLQQALTALQQ